MTVKRERVLLEAVKRDSNQLRALYDHNQQLKETLSDYQLGLELIMSKYRKWIQKAPSHYSTHIGFEFKITQRQFKQKETLCLFLGDSFGKKNFLVCSAEC